MNGQNLGQKTREFRNALEYNLYLARSAICKSAYPGSIPGVASNIFQQKQHKMKELDAQVARVALGGWDNSGDSRPAPDRGPETTEAAGVAPSGLECSSYAWQAKPNPRQAARQHALP